MPELIPEDLLSLCTEELHRLPPGQVLDLIQKLFRDWGLFGESLTLRHEGEEYLASCQTHAFVVYRRVTGATTPHAAPGWPVCLVTAEAVFDECTPLPEGKDYFACHLGLADWLAIIQQTYGQDRAN